MRVYLQSVYFQIAFWLFMAAATSAAVGQDSSDEVAHFDVRDDFRCLILTGLPGDPVHATEFRNLTSKLHASLIERGIPSSNIHVLIDAPPQQTNLIEQINKQSIERVAKELADGISKDETFWLFMIGHADHDGDHARFHIPGPDLRAIDYADLFESLKCEQQVFWITTSSSGWFTEPLSTKGRVIVTATTRGAEPNETEFPNAITSALLTPDPKLDTNKDGTVSVLELFEKTHALVEDSYAVDERAPTEHATIDDNGDGKGTEWEEISAEAERIKQLMTAANENQPESSPLIENKPVTNPKLDGQRAITLKVPSRQVRNEIPPK